MNKFQQLQARYEQLMAISRQLNSTFDLDVLLNQIIDAATDLIGSEEAEIVLADANKCGLCFAATSVISNSQGALPETIVLLGDETLAGWVATRRRTSDCRRCT